MAEKKVIGFEIPLKSRKTNQIVDKQAVTFSSNNKFLIGVQEDGTSLATVEIIKKQPYLILDPKKLNLNLTQDVIILEDGRHAFMLSELEVDSDSNIKLTTHSLTGNSFSNIQFLPNEIVVKKQDEIEKHQVPTLNLDLPLNLFDLANKSTSFVKIKNLPSQFMGVMNDLKSVSSLEIEHKGRAITIARAGDRRNPIIYIAHGTKMLKHSLEDFYIYNPENEKETGFIGMKGSKRATSAYGFNNVKKDTIDKVLDFISTTTSREKILMLSKEQFKAQVIKSKTLSAAKEKTKFDSSTLGITSPQKAKTVEKEPIEEEETREELLARNNQRLKEFEEFLKSGGKLIEENEEEDEYEAELETELEPEIETELEPEAKAEEGTDDDDVGIVSDAAETETTNDSNTPVFEETKQEIAEEEQPETQKGETIEEPISEQPKVVQPEGTPPAPKDKKPSGKTETVDLSDLAKVVGIGLFMFGLFTGFGGILLSIIAVGVGSSTMAFSKNLKNIPLPKGEKALKDEVVKAKKEGKLKKLNLFKKSTAKEESKGIDHLEKEGVISSELALDIKETLKGFENTLGFIQKVETFFKRHGDKIYRDIKFIDAEYNASIRNHDYPKQKQLKAQLTLFKDGLSKLEKYESDFKNLSADFAENIELQYKQVERYQDLVTAREQLAAKDIEKNIESIENQMENLIERRGMLQDKSRAEQEEQEYRDIISKMGILDSQLTRFYQDKSKEKQVNTQLEQLEKTVANPEMIGLLKDSMIGESKKLFAKGYKVAKELEEKSPNKKQNYGKIHKEDRTFADNIESPDNSKEM